MKFLIETIAIYILCLCISTSISLAEDITEEYEEYISNSMDNTPILVSRVKRQVEGSEIKKGKTGLDQSDRRQFLMAHNYFRRIVEPTATDMKFNVWSDGAEKVAQNWASKCKFEHQKGVKVDDATPGENIWVSTGSNYNLTAVTNSWDKEKKDYTYNDKKCAPGKVCGHYTQVVWAKTEKFGCGLAVCDSISAPSIPSLNGKKGLLAVCNYLPAGNLQGAHPYTSGTPCESCPDGYTCKNNLCEKKDNRCGDLTCAEGAQMDTDICLCKCTDDEQGPFCAGSPGAASALVPFISFSLMLSIMAMIITN